jgi:DNA-directed RNA polymerase specialized sigma24 family protein
MLELEKAIKILSSAANVESSNDTSLERDDLYSESFLKYWKVRNEVKSVEEGGHPVAFLRKIVSNVANVMRADARMRSAQYTYRSSDVRAILTDALQGPSESSNVKNSDFDPDDFPNVRSDILACLFELSEDDRISIIMRYYYGYLSKNGSASRKRLDRAVDRLTSVMNNYRGNKLFVGTRRAITNAHANAIIREA